MIMYAQQNNGAIMGDQAWDIGIFHVRPGQRRWDFRHATQSVKDWVSNVGYFDWMSPAAIILGLPSTKEVAKQPARRLGSPR